MTRASFILSLWLGIFCLVNHCFCDIENVDLLKCYEEYFNKENSNLSYEDGILYNMERLAASRYKIEITIKVKEQANPKSFHLLKCTATIHDDAGSLTVEENQCDDGTSAGRSVNEAADTSTGQSDASSELEYAQDDTTELSTTESDVGRQAVDLDSEVQADNAQINNSGEQFVAIPRPQPSSPCIGCSSLVDNNAPGVADLANLAIRHLNKHTPDFAYNLKSLLQVERQVQIVNGVRYILTIDVSPSNCVDTLVENCSGVKTCKVSILEKPWLKIPNGKKFRAVLSNNCTEQWLFGDDGEDLSTKDDDLINTDDEVIKAKKNVDVQATPNSERQLTAKELKVLEEQIIPTNEIGRQKRYVKNEVEKVLDPRSKNLLDLAKEAFSKYSSEKIVRLRVVYATRQSSASNKITRLDFNVGVLEPKPEVETNEVNMRCHTRVSENVENEKTFYTYCALMDDGFNKNIELPASSPKWRTVAQEKLRNEYGELLKFEEVIHVYDSGILNSINIIFDTKSSENNAYRCNLTIHHFEIPLVCKIIELGTNKNKKNYKDPEPDVTNKKVKKDPSDPKFFELAKKALSQFLATANNSKLYQVAQVTHASEQVTLGLSTDIHFIAVLDNHRDILKCFSNIWERFMVNRTVIKVHCSSIWPSPRNKRLLGGKQSRDPKNPKYLMLAKKALSQYLNAESVEMQYKIIIEEVTTQVVSGLSTDINFTAIAVDNSTAHKCQSNIWEKGWINSMIINVNCNQLQSVDRKKRNNVIPGGQTQQDPNNSKYLSLARQSLQQYLEREDTNNHQITVEKVTTQVVAGIITEIDFITKPQDSSSGYKCHSNIWEKPWEKYTKINVDCSPLVTGRKKRDHQLVGGKTQQDPNNPKYVSLAKQSLQQYLEREDTNNHQITVEKVTTQVVAGIITEIDFITKPQDSSSGYKCHSNIWEKPWEKYTRINVDCSPLVTGRKKRDHQLVGGKTQQDPNNPKYVSLAKQSLQQYLEREDTNNHQITVEKVTTQVVAGIITEIDFITKPQDSSSGYKCHSNIWEKPWEKYTRINVDCSPLVTGRKKRDHQLVGGKTQQDPNNPKYLSLAKQSLRQYSEREDTNNHQITVEKVTTQVVAGISTEIDFITKSQDSSSGYKCHSNILESAVGKSVTIDVKCSPLYQDGRRKRRDAKIKQTKPRDPTDPKYLSLAEKSLSQYLHLEGPSNQYQITVEQVTTTVVSGLLTEIYYTAAEKKGYNALTCVSKVWEQLWSNSTQMDVKCDPLPREERSVRDLVQDNNDVIEADLADPSRIKRSIDESHSFDSIDNEDLIKADHFANEALKYIDAMYRHPRQMKVKSIFSFTKDPKEHIGTSAHYRIKMEVGYTNCLALSQTAGNCSLVTDMGASKFCRVSLWLQPDRDHPPRFKVSCDIDVKQIEINKKAQAEQLFFDFLIAHKPSYLNDFKEMRSRLEIFKRNIEKIHELNTHERGTARYGITKFSDLNEEEFTNKYLGLKPHLASTNSMTTPMAKIPNVALPASFDWRDKGAVTEVKNQGACGSCWAFSVTGNIEGQWKLKSGQLVSLSEQELVDCDTVDQGCNGGLPDNAYRAIEQLGGLETEQDYPYEMQNDKCSFNKSLSKVQISGAVNITSNETSMAMWLVEHGPMSIGINANGMQFYFGGISHPWKALCNPKNLDHGVLIVGFGIKEYPLFKKSLPYWIVKNSWGPSWGEQGYYRIYRGDGSCGVNQMASSAVIN